MPIRVLIADDHQLLRSGFAAILDSKDDIEVAGEAADGVQAVRLAADLAPDVVLMDIRMPHLTGWPRPSRSSRAPRRHAWSY